MGLLSPFYRWEAGLGELRNLPEARNWGGCWSGPGPTSVLAFKHWGRAVSESQRVKRRAAQKCSSSSPSPSVASEKFPQALLSDKQGIQTGGMNGGEGSTGNWVAGGQ